MASAMRKPPLKVVARHDPTPVPVAPVSRRCVLGAVLGPLAASLFSSAAAQAAAANRNLSKAELLQQQRAERKEAMKAKSAKIRSGDAKPSF